LEVSVHHGRFAILMTLLSFAFIAAVLVVTAP
jgi:hypothetical protein